MNPDFRDLLLEFNAEGVEYLVVGAHALAVYGYVRATRDLDLWVRPETGNAEKVISALASYGAPLNDLTRDDLIAEDTVFQIGMPPLRVDLLTQIDGVDFEQAWREKYQAPFAGVPVFVISRHHLIINKKTTGRIQDLADVERLESSAGDVQEDL